MRDPNDDFGRFNVRFVGELGSEAHRAHHETLMARLEARAFASEVGRRRQILDAIDGGRKPAEVAQSFRTTTADVRACVKLQRYLDRVAEAHFAGR